MPADDVLCHARRGRVRRRAERAVGSIRSMGRRGRLHCPCGTRPKVLLSTVALSQQRMTCPRLRGMSPSVSSPCRRRLPLDDGGRRVYREPHARPKWGEAHADEVAGGVGSRRGGGQRLVSIPSTVTAELVARQDYDSITVDLQHGLIDYQCALTMMQAINAAGDATVIARPPWLEPGIIMKLLDAGAWGILCPMVNTPADAEALVRACHYAPRGQRSVGPTRAMMLYGPGYIQGANRRRDHARHDRDRARRSTTSRRSRARPSLTGALHRPERSRPVARPSDPDRPDRRRRDGGDRAHPRRRQGGRHQGRHALHDAGLRAADGAARASTSSRSATTCAC